MKSAPSVRDWQGFKRIRGLMKNPARRKPTAEERAAIAWMKKHPVYGPALRKLKRKRNPKRRYSRKGMTRAGLRRGMLLHLGQMNPRSRKIRARARRAGQTVAQQRTDDWYFRKFPGARKRLNAARKARGNPRGRRRGGKAFTRDRRGRKWESTVAGSLPFWANPKRDGSPTRGERKAARIAGRSGGARSSSRSGGGGNIERVIDLVHKGKANGQMIDADALSPQTVVADGHWVVAAHKHATLRGSFIKRGSGPLTAGRIHKYADEVSEIASRQDASRFLEIINRVRLSDGTTAVVMSFGS